MMTMIERERDSMTFVQGLPQPHLNDMREALEEFEVFEDFEEPQSKSTLSAEVITLLKDQTAMFLATSDARGMCDCTLRTGPAGFIRAVDNHRLLYLEGSLHSASTSLGNIFDNPWVSMYVTRLPAREGGLYIKGQACILTTETIATDPKLTMLTATAPPEELEEHQWILVEVENSHTSDTEISPPHNA